MARGARLACAALSRLGAHARGPPGGALALPAWARWGAVVALDPRGTAPQTSARAHAAAAPPPPRDLPASVPDAERPSTSGNTDDPQAKITFEKCWDKLVKDLGGLANMQSPREIVWLNGAPGSGKGATTPYVLKARGLAKAINVSSLLANDQNAAETMAKGILLEDSAVLSLLLKALFDPSLFGGACLVDGFPRTPLQVECTKLLYDRLHHLHLEHLDDPSVSLRWNRPAFKCVVLYVDQEESIKRQLSRGRRAKELKQRAENAGLDAKERARLFRESSEVRSTDMSEDLARHRYSVFKNHYGTLLRLKQYFPFHLIDGMGNITEVERQIENELRYQSSLELSQRTYDRIKHIPLAKDLTHRTRERLVSRLDRYCLKHLDAFESVLEIIDQEVMPLLRRNSLSGYALFQTTADVFCEDVAVDMLIDVLSDRGFSVSYRNELRPSWDDAPSDPVAADVPPKAPDTERPHGFSTTASFRMVRHHRFRITFDSARQMLRGNSPAGFGGNQVTSRIAAVEALDAYQEKKHHQGGVGKKAKAKPVEGKAAGVASAGPAAVPPSTAKDVDSVEFLSGASTAVSSTSKRTGGGLLHTDHH